MTSFWCLKNVCFLTIILYLISSAFCETTEASAETEIILESPNVTNWGDWGKLENCSPSLLVTGFQVKVEPRASNSDNTALNGVLFTCGIPNKPDYINIYEVTSSYGRWGTAREERYCQGYAVGFQLESQKPQLNNDDNVAAVNLRIICDDGEVLEGYDENDEQYLEAEYTQIQRCPDQMGFCGLQTQVQKMQWWADDTALNNIRVKCCPVPNLYKTTTVLPETIQNTTTTAKTA